MKLSVVVITQNEEANIDECLESVRWADEKVVVDGGSQDKTVEKAKACGAVVYENPFKDFSTQKNMAIGHATHRWVLMLDSDERITPDLAKEIQQTIKADPGEHVYAIKRKTHFFGKELRFTGTQGDYPIRLIPAGKAEMFQPVHEEVKTTLPTKRLHSCMEHYSTRSREHYFKKMEAYLPFEVSLLKGKKRQTSLINLYLRPVAQFIKLYFFDLGILDGSVGFEFSYLSAYYVFKKYQRAMKETD